MASKKNNSGSIACQEKNLIFFEIPIVINKNKEYVKSRCKEQTCL